MATPPNPPIPQTPIVPVPGQQSNAIGQNQLAQSVNTAITQLIGYLNNAQGNSGNGYLQLMNGLIIQWATGTTNSGAGTFTQTITFPIPFTTAVYAILSSTNQGSSSSGVGEYNVISKTLTQVTVAAITGSGGNTQSPTILAIGV